MSETEISELPDEMLELVFCNLQLSDRKNIRLVCRRWCSVCYSPCLIKNELIKLPFYGDLVKLNFSGRYSNIRILAAEQFDVDDDREEIIRRKCAVFWSECGSHVKELTLFISLTRLKWLCLHLKQVFSRAPNLEKLTLSYRGIPLKVKKVFSENQERKLLSLNLKILPSLTGDQFTALVESVPPVEEFNLDVDDSDLYFGPRHYIKEVYDFNRDDYYRQSEYVDKFEDLDEDLIDAVFMFTTRHRNTLKRFQLHSRAMKDRPLTKILSPVGPQLEELHLPGCRSLTDNCLPILQNFPNLRFLRLGSSYFTDFGLYCLMYTHMKLEEIRKW